jgi:hypothetical protein
MKIIKYKKITDKYTTHAIRLHDIDGQQQGMELCEIDGYTYVSVPDGDLPKQSDKIKIEEVNLTDESSKQIYLKSPHAQLLDDRIIEWMEQEAYMKGYGKQKNDGSWLLNPIVSIVGYASSTDSAYAAEAKEFLAWRDGVWAKTYAYLSDPSKWANFFPTITEIQKL